MQTMDDCTIALRMDFLKTMIGSVDHLLLEQDDYHPKIFCLEMLCGKVLLFAIIRHRQKLGNLGFTSKDPRNIIQKIRFVF